MFVFSVTLKVQKPRRSRRIRKFNFLEAPEFASNPYASSKIEPKSTPEPSDDHIDKLIALIISQFIDSWYHNISDTRLFQESLEAELRIVVKRVQAKLASVELADVIVNRILDVLREHFVHFCQAESAAEAKGVSARVSTDSTEYHLAVAQNYSRGKLHRGVDLQIDDRASTSELQKEHLRKKVAGLLPLLLSLDEASSDLVFSLVREILACTVLLSVFDVMSDNDFVNLLVVNLMGANLRRRDQVKKLRAALDEHTRADNAIQALGEQKPKTHRKSEEVHLDDILGSPRALLAFKLFLQEENRSPLLDIWEKIESIKSPLEDDADMSLSLEFSSVDDLANVHEMLVRSSSIADPKEIALLSLHIEQRSFTRARRVLYLIQEHLYHLLAAECVVFLESKFFNSHLIFVDQQQSPSKDPTTVLENDDSETAEVSPVVFHAVEDAFNEIMKSSKSNEQPFYTHEGGASSLSSLLESVEAGPDIPTVYLTLSLKKGLFGDDREEEETMASSRLFDSSESSGSDSDTDPLSDRDSDLGDLQVLFAAPGNLKLSEEVVKLDKDIGRLTEQLSILNPLVRKAELTHNVAELKILRKSRASLEREIDAKELQKQQYMVQENENSLYGKSRVRIQSYVTAGDRGKEYVLYIVEVQRFMSGDPTIPSAGWVVARRFSQFHHLHVYLRKQYPEVEALKFPKRAVLMLKFQQRQLVEVRKSALEGYLDRLLQLPEVCGDRVFRSFLSSENFSFGRRHRSLLKSIAKNAPLKSRKNPVAAAVSELMQTEINQYDSQRAFVKPICDLLVNVFDLNSSKSWLRGRALVVILQQVFGTTIENMVRDQERSLRSESRARDLVESVTVFLFPNGKFRDPPAVRSASEISATRNEARVLFRTWMDVTCSRIFGGSNTHFAQSKLFAMLQNPYLNLHLILSVFDELIDAIKEVPNREEGERRR